MTKLENSHYTRFESKGRKLTDRQKVECAEVQDCNGATLIRFLLPVGAGHSSLCVYLDETDFCNLMRELASKRPTLAATFAECTVLALQRPVTEDAAK